MTLESIKLYSYNLPLKKQLILHEVKISQREGFVLEIKSDTNFTVYSEIAPLPSFSKETLSDVIVQVMSFKNKFLSNTIPPDILSQLSSYVPSVRFGIESALLQLTALTKELSLIELLHPNANQIISVNALLSGSQSEIVERASQLYKEGYRAFKIKVGRLSINEEVKIVHKVREIVGNDCLIRLDANRAFEFETALEFYEQIKTVNIDYIEEPFQSFEMLENYLEKPTNEMPIALDESLAELEPEELNQLFSLKAIVLKPTLLGYTKSMMFAKKAFALGIQPVISSSFESSIGIYILASMGAIIDSQIPVGLDTLSWLQDDIVLEPLIITNGKIDLSQYTKLTSQIDFSKLTEVQLDN